MPKDKNCDSVFFELCNIRYNEAECDFRSQTDDLITFSNEDIENAIDKVNTGKSSDEYGLCAEHFKSVKQTLTPVIKDIFNLILK